MKTVKTRARDLGLDALKISKEQSAWERYRGEHCGNVYLKWKQGTIRYEMGKRPVNPSSLELSAQG